MGLVRRTFIILAGGIILLIFMNSRLGNGRMSKKNYATEREKMYQTEAVFLGHNYSTTMEMVSDMNTTIHTWPWVSKEMIQLMRKKCSTRDWLAAGPLPTVSVIVSFGDFESLYNILHTAHSVVQRTPPEVLTEVIIVADNTSKEEHREILPNYVRHVFGDLVKVVYTTGPASAIRARHLGSRRARGDVIAYFDSHQEVQPGWAEPMLYEIKKNPKTLVSGSLDWMERTDTGWKYINGPYNWVTVFDWTFNFQFQDILQKKVLERPEPTEPFSSPAQMGATCAISRKFLHEIGDFDEGMEAWGGENIDLSLRAWMCGGRVVVSPCSRASHLEGQSQRSYRNNMQHQTDRNYKRIVEVWLDEYKHLFYQYKPHIKAIDPGDLTSRLELRKRCPRSFTWYLENAFPQLGIPSRDGYAYGGLRNNEIGMCLQNQANRVVALANCDSSNIEQIFYWDKENHLRFPLHIFYLDALADVGRKDKGLRFIEYLAYYKTGRKVSSFIHIKDGPIMEVNTATCLEAIGESIIGFRPCANKSSQHWSFKIYSPAYDKLDKKAMISTITSAIYKTIQDNGDNKKHNNTI